MVIVLSFLEGFSYQEIAEIADLQLGTVKSRLHRGRKLLQKEIEAYKKTRALSEKIAEIQKVIQEKLFLMILKALLNMVEL